MRLKLPHPLINSEDDEDVEFTSIKCGVLIRDGSKFYNFYKIIEPTSVPLFLIEYIAYGKWNRAIVTDGERYQILAYSTTDIFTLANYTDAMPSKSQVHEVISDYVNWVVQ